MLQPLKFIFFTGCLEPGCDGVGDYTRILAKSLSDKQHTCLLISLKDDFVPQNPNRIPFIKPKSVNIIRFKNGFDCHNLLKECVHGFCPNFISLQFVPYSFHNKGLCYNLTSLFKKFSKNIPWQVMFHETWIGLSPHPIMKEKCIGFFQKKCILSLLKTIQPLLIHTHTPLYQYALSSIGYNAKLLPLFSSIISPPPQKTNSQLCEFVFDGDSLSPEPEEYKADTPSKICCSIALPQLDDTQKWFYPFLLERNIPITPDNRSKYWLFGIFGALHPQWPPLPLLKNIQTIAKKNNKLAIILHFGHIGPGEKLYDTLYAYADSHLSLYKLGPIHQVKIWTLLQNLDFGIATSPYHLLPKSASACAMLENGLPLIVNRIEAPEEPPYQPYLHKPNLIIHTQNQNLETALLSIKRQPYQYTIEKVSSTFLEHVYASL